MKRLLRIANSLELYLCNGAMAAMLLLLSYQVALRYILGKSNAWSEESARYFFIWLIFVSTSYAERENAHIRIESLQKVFPRAARKWVALAGELILLGFCALLVKISAGYTATVIATRQVSLGLKLNMGAVYAAIPVGYLLMCVRILGNIVTGKYRTRPPADPDEGGGQTELGGEGL